MIGENTHIKAATWEQGEVTVFCWLKDAATRKRVKITYEECGKIIDLKSIDTFGIPRADFDDLRGDLLEPFKGYTDFRGLFSVKIQ